MEGQNFDEQNSAINISDVIEVIEETDPDFGMMDGYRMQNGAPVVNPVGSYIQILEQPASKALRFRYECEGRSAGSIPGVNSTPENKTYPTIQIVGYKGRAVVVVSCITKDSPYRPHPHNLVGKDTCKKGICTVEINNENMIATFPNLGIQCVKKKDIEEALKLRQDLRVDPYRTGFAHKNQPSSIDLNCVRLCFQAFVEGNTPGKFSVTLPPVNSDPIYDKKAMADLVICRLSHCSGSVVGGQEVILLCEKVAKEDIAVRFYEEKDGEVVWEKLGEFTPTQVHKQVAIHFRTPRYHTLEIESPVRAFIQLRRPSDNATSDPLPFMITPLDSDLDGKRKRKKVTDSLRQFENTEQTLNLRVSEAPTVKREPESSPNPYWQYGQQLSPVYASRTPSPHYQANVLTMAAAVSPIHQTPGLSPNPITQPTQANVTYSGGTVYQNDIGVQYHELSPAVDPTQAAMAVAAQPQGAMGGAGHINVDTNMDFQLNSKDLEELGVLASISACSISTEGVSTRRNEENMTDSLTKFATLRYTEFE